MNSFISASVMCASPLELGQNIRELENAGVDYLHLDIMDSVFVPNITLGIDTVNTIKATAGIPLDIHLLIDKPSRIIRSLDFGSGDFVTVHAECSERIMENAAYVKQKGAAFGLALNPDTTVEEIAKYLPYVDMLNIMLIVPGFSGSTIIHGIMEKVRNTRKYADKKGFSNIIIEVDGSVTPERARILKAFGANMFVGGTASIFKRDVPFAETVAQLREAIACTNGKQGQN